MNVTKRAVWMTASVLVLVLVLSLGSVVMWKNIQHEYASRVGALAHTRVHVNGQPDMSVQAHNKPGEPSIGALAPFTRVEVKCVASVNDKQYAFVTVDPAAEYFPGEELYVGLVDVEARDGAPNCP